MDVLVLVSPHAREENNLGVLAIVETFLAHGKVEVVQPRSAPELNEAVDLRGTRTIIVVGGDNSLRRVVNRLLQHGELSRTPLGLIPMGPTDDLARSLNLPLEPQEAARTIVHLGTPRPVDLIRDDTGSVVLHAARLGAGTGAAVPTPFGGSPDRFAAGLRRLRSGGRVPGEQLGVLVDGEALTDGRERVLTVVIANCPTVVGSMPFARSAVPVDGLLDVEVILLAGGLRSRLAFGRARDLDLELQDFRVRQMQGRSVVVEVPDGVAVPSNVDDLPGALRQHREWRIASDAWRLIY